MLTQSQINSFKTWARAKGFTEIEIANEVARKNQEEARQNVSPTKSQPSALPSPTQMIKNTNTATNLEQPVKKQGIVSKVGNFLIPRTTKLLETVKGTFDLDKNQKAFEKTNNQLSEQSRKYISLAMNEKDPIRKKEYLSKSRELSQIVLQNTENFGKRIDDFQKQANISDTDNITKYSARQGVGIAGETASWMLPINKLVPGAKLISGIPLVGKIIKSGIEGGIIGTISGITSPDDIDLNERLDLTKKTAKTGAIVGGALSTATSLAEVPINIVKKFVNNNQGRIYNLFRITPSARAEFRKSTGNMNFAEEIIKRDAKDMAGKSYTELLEHFTERKQTALNTISEELTKIKKTVDKNEIIEFINKQKNNLNPKRGNVGQSEAVQKLNGVLEELKENPNKLSLKQLNNIKRQLQDAGEAAFSPNGSPSPSTKALAKVSTFIKDILEREQPKLKEMNKLVQLYSLAKSSIEKTGDREASKISNDIVQKFFQVLPGGAGFALAGAPGGVLGLVAGGLVGSARVKYFDSTVQTRLISLFQEVSEKQGIKNAGTFAKKIVDEISKVIVRKATQGETQTNKADNVMQEEIGSNNGLVDSIIKESGGVTTEPSSQEKQEVKNEVVRIRNKQTGEIKEVLRTDLGQYGLGQDQNKEGAIPNEKDLLLAMVIDLQTTGGKNIPELKTIFEAYQEVFDKDKDKEPTAADRKRINAINTAEGIFGQVEELALTAPEGIEGFVKGNIGSIPGVDAGSAEDLTRVTKGYAKAIASAFAGEVGVATDSDIERWLGLMPKPGDTLNERKRALERLKSQIDLNKKQFGL